MHSTSMEPHESLPGKNACTSALPGVVDALYVLGGKWKLPVLLCLMHGPRRFNEILHEVGISPKILAKELKDLELNELLERTVQPGTPPTILYAATEHSRTLKDVLLALGDWGARHRELIRSTMRKRA